MAWEDGGPLEPPEVLEATCPRCKGDGIDPDDRDDWCYECNGDGVVYGEKAAEALKLTEDDNDRRFDAARDEGRMLRW